MLRARARHELVELSALASSIYRPRAIRLVAYMVVLECILFSQLASTLRLDSLSKRLANSRDVR